MVVDELGQVATRVRHERELEPVSPELLQHRQRVLVQVEVLRALPGARHRHGAFAGALGLTAHAADDVLGEPDPDLLVVLELWMSLDVLDRRGPRSVVPRGIELKAETLA